MSPIHAEFYKTHGDALRAFLTSDAGRAFISALIMLKPTSGWKGDSDATLYNSGLIAGHENAVNMAVQLSRPPPTLPTELEAKYEKPPEPKSAGGTQPQ